MRRPTAALTSGRSTNETSAASRSAGRLDSPVRREARHALLPLVCLHRLDPVRKQRSCLLRGSTEDHEHAKYAGVEEHLHRPGQPGGAVSVVQERLRGAHPASGTGS